MNLEVFRDRAKVGSQIQVAEDLCIPQFLVSPVGDFAAMDLPANPEVQLIIVESLRVLGLSANLPDIDTANVKPGAPALLWLTFDTDDFPKFKTFSW